MHAAFFWAVLGLCCGARAFSGCGEQGLPSVAVCGPLIAVVSLVAEHRFEAHGISSCGTQTAGPQHVGPSWTRNRTPALPGGFLTTGPPGKPSERSFVVISYGIEREQKQILRLIPNLERPSLATWSGVTHTLPTSHCVLPFCC